MRTIEQMISQEVLVCVSSLVSTLANMYGRVGNPAGPRDHDVEYLPEAAMELASPVLDYEKAAREDGWAEVAADPNPGDTLRGENGPCLYHADLDRVWDAGDWLGACAETGIDPHEREVFEHWAVTDWFAEKLEEAGEKVDHDFASMAVWARTTTGQAIYVDAVIERIYADCAKSVEG